MAYDKTVVTVALLSNSTIIDISYVTMIASVIVTELISMIVPLLNSVFLFQVVPFTEYDVSRRNNKPN